MKLSACNIAVCIILGFTDLAADPLVIRGAEGAYLPVITESWHEKNGGVLLELHEDVSVEAVRDAVLKTFPSMNVEVFGKNIFFSSTDITTLFSVISGVDIPVNVITSPFTALEDTEPDTFQFLKNTPEPAACDTCAVADVHTVTYGKGHTVTFELRVMERSNQDGFSRVRGRIQAVVSVSGTKKNGVRRSLGDALLVLEGDTVRIRYKERTGRRQFTLSALSRIQK